ncbi:AMP-binding protein [Nocardioides salarius]|uniref:AMP-binding protein n=1 Tax=Nocardioides salarius TaxID=374513 RepID=UPI0030F5897D
MSRASIGEWLREVAADPSRRGAELVIESGRTTPAALDADADALAHGLLDLGLVPGDRVAVLSPARVESLQSWFGIVRAAMVEVPLNPAAGTTALGWCLARSRARAVVCAPELLDTLLEAVAQAPADQTADHPGTQVEVVLLLPAEPGDDPGDEPGDEPGPTAPTPAPGGVRVLPFEQLRSAPARPLPTVRATAPAVVLFTSGTTGPPKGVVLSHRANLNLARRTVELMGYSPADRLYSVFPLYHSNARCCSVLAAMEAGAGLLLHRRFTASGFWEVCRREQVTAFNYQGAMMSILHRQPARDHDRRHRVRAAFGAPCPPEVFDAFERRFGVELTEIYGSTEVSLVCEMPPTGRRVGTAGRSSPQYEVAVVDDLDRPNPPGEPGEIVVRPRRPGWMFDGYDADPVATRESWRNLWFHTGDRGVLDDDGFLTFLDRVKDTVRRRGENISTWEVERVLAEHPSVAQVAAYGVASELSEEDVMVAVVPAEAGRLDPEALLAHCAGRLTSFARPRYVRVVDALPMTPSQRVEKFRLREEGITVDTYDAQDAHDAGGVTAR